MDTMRRYLRHTSIAPRTIVLVPLTIAAMLATIAVAASSAHAGTYTIYNCPSAPVPNGSAGPWSVFSSGSPYTQKSTCSGGLGDFIGPLAGSIGPGTSSGVILYAPSGITITYISVYWYAAGDTNGTPIFGDAYAGGTLMGEGDAPVNHSFTPDHFSLPAGSTSFNLQDYCSTGNGPNGCNFASAETPMLKMLGSAITLEDDTPPSGQATGGGLFSSGEVSGTQSLSYSASDGLAGVASVALLVNGSVVATNNSSCPYDNYLACPASVTGSLSWNTASVGNGPYQVALQATNAAGDTTILDSHGITTSNTASGTASSSANAAGAVAAVGPGSPAAQRGPANGTNASDQAKLTARWASTSSKQVRTSRYGAVDRITGRLETSTGQPISGASLDVFQTPAYQGAQARLSNTGVRTGPTGEWTLTLPRDIPSSTLHFAYRSHSNDTIPVATTTLTLRVHAGIALRIAPRTSSVGQSIYFSGTLHGTPIPEGGKQLVLEARSGRAEWIQFDTIRTNAKGRYRASYRFKFAGPIRYQFRVLSRFEAGFPFLDGTSNVVPVFER